MENRNTKICLKYKRTSHCIHHSTSQEQSLFYISERHGIMKPTPMCLIFLLVVLFGQAGMAQATDPVDRSGVISNRDASVHVLTSGEIDSSTVEVGAYVEITYDKGGKLETVRGYIKAVDTETLTIGRGLWKEQVAFKRIQKLILAESDREIDSLKETTDTLSVRKENRRGAGLMFEIGWNQGINTSSRNIFYGYQQKSEEGLPWSLSFYFNNRILSGEKTRRFGVKYTRQVVQILPTDLDSFLPEIKDGKTYWSSSLLLVYQHIVKRSTRIVLLADIGMGIALIDNYYNSGSTCGDWICLPEIGSRFSAGMAFLLPIHAHIGLQASVRADLLSVSDKYPFTSGMSVAFGLLYEVY